MEPHPCSDRDGAVLDTGQRQLAGPDGAASAPASAATDKLTGGCNQDGPKNAPESTDEALGEASAQAAEETHSECSSPAVLQEKTSEECAGSDGAVNIVRGSAECSEENAEMTGVCEFKSVTPIIVIEHDSAESGEGDNSNDDDMDPLITIDDTESQSSDLINFDTVSYDVMCQHGGEDDDDEKSIATLSSLSCDIKVDSPSKHSQASNSSGLSNLLDSSIKETLGLAVNPSAPLTDGAGSAASSCPSSPSLQSSKTVSSAVDESISEAFMNVLQISEADEARLVNCDSKVLSEKDSEDSCRVESEESACAVRPASPQSVDVFRDPNPVEETIDIQCGDLVLDSNGAEEMSCPVVENLSHSNAENNLRCSPNESNIELQMYDGDHNISESLNVPEISILNSPEDDIDMHKEDAVNSSPEIREPEPSALLTPNENDNQKFHEEENEVNSAVMSSSLLTGNHVNHPTDSGVQDSNDNLVGICEGEDIISFMLHPDSPAKVPEISQNISSTSIEEIMSISTSNNVDINVALSSSTEDDIHFSTGSRDEALVSSTSNEDNSCSAPVVSSILENEANGTEEHVSSQTSIVNENIPLEENISSSTASLVSGEDISVDTSEKITTNIMDSQNIEDVSNCSQVARTPSPADSALSMSNCVTSEESLQRMSCDSSNGTMELISLEAINGDLSSTSDGLSVPAGNINDGFQANGDLTQSATVMLDSKAKNSEPVESPNSGKVVESPLSEGALSEEVMNNAQECLNVNFSARSQLVEDLKENSDSISSHAETGFPNESGSFETVERPTTLPEINQNNPSPEKSSGMNFSEFLDLFNMSNREGLSKPKQYDVATLDEAQQIASLLVDDIIQMAMIKVEEKLTSSESLIEDRVEAVQVAQILVDGVLSEAHASFVDVGKAEISTICDIKDSGSHHPASSSATVDSQVTDNILSTEPCLVSFPESTVNITEELPDSQKNILNISEDVCEAKTEPSQEESQAIADENLPCIAETTPNINSDSTSDIVNISEDNSLSDSLVDGQSKDSVRTSSTENAGADLSRSSLLTTSELGLRSEASLFVDGVLQEAVKKYEESSSSETSPVKIRSLALDSEFFQEDEELATPCGEMLTEHFMDFESGRNVSVFCSIPENRNEDHLLAYDRVAHTIGNREVDSDTGKSLSVFRIEEDVFYEIQRASTCTSVFESVEEEDEDMIDTTIPVEERPEKTLSTSASFPSYDKEKFGTSDDPFSADCDAFEDAVGAFLSKERLAHNELRNRAKSDFSGATEQQSEVTCRALVLRHPEIDISNSDEKKRMAEKWANGGESEVPDTPEMREKQKAIKEALDSDDDVAVKLCRLALTEGGLINDALRREAWPRMLGLDPTLEVNAPSLEDLKSHPEYEQVVLDVNRSLKRFPPDIPKDHRETLQDKLTRLIMYVISKHPHLRYYQGYHDVAVTFLLVVGESIAFQIMERLSTEHLSDCMQPTMERTSYLLHFIYPLLHRLHPTLADYLERSEVGTMFCLPWFLTWFGHSLDHYKDVVRLYDHFLASPPLAPLYVAAVLVAHRADEVLAVDCDMAAIHALLSHIPDSLPLEILLRDATELYMKFPPQSIEREVEERFRNEQETEARERVRALPRRDARRTASGTWQLAEIQDRIGGSMMVLNRWMPPWVVQQQRLSMRLLFASATFFVGFYVYSRGGDMLPYP